MRKINGNLPILEDTPITKFMRLSGICFSAKLHLQAPKQPGNYTAFFVVLDSTGQLASRKFFVEVEVVESEVVKEREMEDNKEFRVEGMEQLKRKEEENEEEKILVGEEFVEEEVVKDNLSQDDG